MEARTSGAASAVLRSSDLMDLVMAYQDGVYGDLVPLMQAHGKVLVHHQAGFLLHALQLPSTTHLRRLFRCRRQMLTPDVLGACIAFGHLDASTFLMQHVRPPAAAAVLAASRGHLDTLRLLLPSISRSMRLMDVAAESGHLTIVKNLHSEGFLCTTYAIDRAAGRGRLEVVEYLDVAVQAECTAEAMDRAAAGGHVQVVRYLHSRRREGCTADAIDDAASAGHLEVVKFLLAHGKPFTSRAAMGAAKNGHVQVYAFMEELRSSSPCDLNRVDA